MNFGEYLDGVEAVLKTKYGIDLSDTFERYST